jgi:type VI secretion system protein ImpF
MAELTNQDKLQPSLLDRLTDEDSHNPRESREQRVLSMRRLKECVLRDLAWLLNTTNLSIPEQLEPYPAVEASVVNYGIPDLAGLTSSSVNAGELARLVKSAIVHFEPRILADSIKVDLRLADERMDANTLTMEIEGELWAIPVPVHLLLDTAVDLESGTFKVRERSG